jgi:hypothetical protein
LGRVSTVPGWGMGGRHGGMGLRAVGNLPERCSQGAHSRRAHPRHSFNSKASRASTGCPRLLGRGLAASGLQRARLGLARACTCVGGRACWTPTSEAWNCRRRAILRFVDTARLPSTATTSTWSTDCMAAACWARGHNTRCCRLQPAGMAHAPGCPSRIEGGRL